jgi:hypothetical protein
VLTAGMAYRPEMPRPIRAGVLGIARTTRALPLAVAMVSQRTPAMMLSCSAPATWPAQAAAASPNICGLTAQTTSEACASEASACGSAVMPSSACSLSRCGAWGSTTMKLSAGMPLRTSPPRMAPAMLPPPMNARVEEFMASV